MLCDCSWPETKQKSRLNQTSENHDNDQDENVAVFGDSDLREVVVISGPVFSEVSAVFESGKSEFLGLPTECRMRIEITQKDMCLLIILIRGI